MLHLYIKPVNSTCVHKTSLEYTCKNNIMFIRNVQKKDITIKRNVWGTDITSDGKLLGMDITIGRNVQGLTLQLRGM